MNNHINNCQIYINKLCVINKACSLFSTVNNMSQTQVSEAMNSSDEEEDEQENLNVSLNNSNVSQLSLDNQGDGEPMRSEPSSQVDSTPRYIMFLQFQPMYGSINTHPHLAHPHSLTWPICISLAREGASPQSTP